VALLEPGPQPVHLLIGGEGPDYPSLEALARSALGERCRLLGRIADPTVLYAAIDVFALASHEEGFGLVFIEAAFQGVPSVAARVGGVPYAVEHERTGLLVPDRDPPALAAAIGRLLGDCELHRTIGAAAQARARREFSERQMATRYRAVLFGHPAAT
jgi:glycosyltransferase involved in cell wall biosynthesis